MKVCLLQETEIGAGYFERVERLDPAGLRNRGAGLVARRRREARYLGKNELVGWCRSYGDTVIAVWRYTARGAP